METKLLIGRLDLFNAELPPGRQWQRTEIPGCGGLRGRLYLNLHSRHQNDSSLKMGSNKSYFNATLIVRDSHKTASTDQNF